MRDIIKFIFGEISESVLSQAYYQEQDENVYEVPGEMKLTDFNDLTNFGIEDPRMTTIGGVVFRYLDRLPKVGDQVVIEGFIATVLEMHGHRLAKVRIATPGGGEFASEEGDDGGAAAETGSSPGGEDSAEAAAEPATDEGEAATVEADEGPASAADAPVAGEARR
jgi:hypothetical protein